MKTILAIILLLCTFFANGQTQTNVNGMPGTLSRYLGAYAPDQFLRIPKRTLNIIFHSTDSVGNMQVDPADSVLAWWGEGRQWNKVLSIQKANSMFASNASLTNYLTIVGAASSYQPIGSYLTASSLSPYLTISDASATYQPIGTYLSNETDPLWTASPSHSITLGHINNWNVAFGWGNHGAAGYQLTSNLQNNLTGSSTKYPSVDAVNAALSTKQGTLNLTTTGSGAATLVGNTLNVPTPSAGPTYTAGVGINIAGSVLSNTAPDQTVTLTAGRGIAITGTYPNFTISLVTPTITTRNSALGNARTLNSNFTISTTKEAIVTYTVTCSVTNPLLIGTSTATAFLEYSMDGGTTWQLPSQNGNSSGVGITVTVQLTNGQTGTLNGVIPANALIQIRSSTLGTASVTYVTGQETVY